MTSRTAAGHSASSALRTTSWDGLLICVAAFALVSMARLHEIIPGFSMFRPAILFGGLSLLLYVVDGTRERSLQYLKHPLTWVALFFVAWAFVGAPAGYYASRSITFLVGAFSRVIVLGVLIAACVRHLPDVRRLMMALVVGGMVFSMITALPAGFRGVYGGAYDPNDSAMFITLTIPLAVYLAVHERNLVLKCLFAAAILIGVVGLVRTGSRGGFLAFAAMVGYTLFFFRGIKPAFRVLTIVAVVGAMAFAGTTEFWTQMQTITDPEDYNHTDPTGRIAIWERARGYMMDNPLTGVGVGNFSVAEERHPLIAESIARGQGFKYSVAHSIWFEVGAEMGFPGLIAFVALFLVAAVHLRRIVRRGLLEPHSGDAQEAAGMASALIGCLVVIAVAGTFLSNSYSGMVWGIFGLILGLLKVARNRPAGGTSRTAASPVARTPAPRRNVAFAPSTRLRPAAQGRTS